MSVPSSELLSEFIQSVAHECHKLQQASDVLTATEAALLLKTKKDTIYQAIAAGELRAGDISPDSSTRSTFRILRSDLDKWMFRRRKKR